MPIARSERHLLRLALFEPDIPQNTGTMLRMAACLGLGADLIEPAGFPVSDRAFRRAGMDYLDKIAIERHLSFAHFVAAVRERRHRLVLLTTKATVDHCKFRFEPGDILIVGRESAGAPHAVHEEADARIRIPMRAGMRSLNVAICAALACGEALRQLDGWAGPDKN
jgi:tRNA (cytidine/uridine-2'-O-)-methyltransferase